MGFRFRKSINLGGGFRINLSKSGIGYSWGVKGYRVTKTSKGRTRTTLSLPGTGFSYVYETGKKQKNSSKNKFRSNGQQPIQPIDNNSYDTKEIANSVATSMVSEGLEDMLASARKALRLNNLSTICFWITLILGFVFPVSFILSAFFLILKIYVKTKGVIDLEYIIDHDQKSKVDKRMNPMIAITKSKKVWRIMQTSKVIDKKYSSGASNTINRTLCSTSTKTPFPFKANHQAASFKSGKETLIFLPDKLFIMQGNKIGALNYSDVFSKAHTTRFIETDTVPKDSQIVGHTWEYVNKSGGPDKRFKDNRKLPVCLYGELELSSSSGLNTIIMYSNPNID